jgi:hypothetical protein|tara:strand:+ start:46 stop:558 length:513 start_codon:yes stop_codon:yes gene_type:complete
MPNNTKYKYTFYALDVGYVGSTYERINDRMRKHRSVCYNSKNTNYKYPLYKYLREHHPDYNFDPINVVILDVVSGLTIAQARAVEQQFIDQLKPELNKNAAKQELTKNEYQNQKIECPCGATICRAGKTRHVKTKKHKTNIQVIANTLNEYYKTSEDKHHCTLKYNEKFK